MYAILQQGGHQYRVAPGDRLLVDRLGAEVGSVISLEPVLLVESDGTTTVGTPVVEGARVAARVVAHPQGAKLRVFTYKPKKRHRRTFGHRSRLTELRVEALLGAGDPLPDSATTKERPVRKARSDAEARSEERAPSAEVTPAKAPRAHRTTRAAPSGEAATEAADAAAGEQLSTAPSRRPRRTTKTAPSTGAETEE